jgi:hypothetical protein
MSCKGCRRYIESYLVCVFIDSYDSVGIKPNKCICRNCLVKTICDDRCEKFYTFFDSLGTNRGITKL